MSLLDVKNFSLTLGKKQLLVDISLQASAGLVTVILGPNGAGKTTLLKSICGLNLNPHVGNSSNSITFDNLIINSWPVYKRVEHGLLYLPQQTSLFQSMTVRENLEVVYQYHPAWRHQQIDAFYAQRDELLTTTTLSHSLEQQAGLLSGGQKRKLEVVRALLMKPKLLMLDEPFAGVDPKSIYELKALFTQLAQSNIGIIISDHHVDQLLSIANHVYVIIGGRVVTSGSIKEILENSYTRDSYLGAQFYQEMVDKFIH